MSRRLRLTRREANPELSAQFPIESQFRSALRSHNQNRRTAANSRNNQGRSSRRINQINFPPAIVENRNDAQYTGLPANSIRTYRNTVGVNTVEELLNLIKKPDIDHKKCFKQSMIIFAPTLYGDLLCKPALTNQLVERHLPFFLGLFFHKIQNNFESTGFDPNGAYVTEARTNFPVENFHDLYTSFSHRLIKRQDFIQTIKLTEQFTEEKWLSNVATIINNLQTLENYEKKNLMKFFQKDLPLDQSIRLESTEIPITTSQNLLIDDYISPVKTALCHKIICFSCCQGFKSDLVSYIQMKLLILNWN
jgi:hypothetical protein